LGLVQFGQVVEADGNIRVTRAEGFLDDRQGALLKRFGVGVAALGLVLHG
jgi:hypothetical protein